MSQSASRRQVQRLAGSVARTAGKNNEHQAIRGFLLGSLYSLDAALRLGFNPRLYAARSSAYQGELTRLLRSLSQGSKIVRGKWLAGFYFNSSLQHLAGSYHRLLKLVTVKHHSSVPCLVDIAVAQGVFSRAEVDALDEVHRDVNDLKHGPEGLLKRRRVTVNLAVRAAEQAVDLFNRVT